MGDHCLVFIGTEGRIVPHDRITESFTLQTNLRGRLRP